MTLAKLAQPSWAGEIPKVIGYCAAFTALGLFSASLGTTLPGLAEHTRSRLSSISFLFAARSLGYLLGSLAGGRLYDRMPGHRVMTGALIALIAMTTLVPLMPQLWLLTALVLLLGMAEGAIDVGGNTLLVWVYQARVGPFMNALHFFFGIGAFLSPIVVAQAVSASGDIYLAYWALAILMLPGLFWLARRPSPAHPDHADGQPTVAQSEGRRRSDAPLLLLILLFFFLYVGAEIGFGSWAYTYAVTVGLATTTTAAYLTSAFWGSFTAGRLLSVPLATRFSPRSVLMADLLVGLVGLSTILAWPGSAAALWIGALTFGLGMASIFPTMISLAERHMAITGRVTGWFLTASSLGAMALPWVIGQLFEPVGPHISIVLIAVDLLAAAMLLIGLTVCSLSRGDTP